MNRTLSLKYRFSLHLHSKNSSMTRLFFFFCWLLSLNEFQACERPNEINKHPQYVIVYVCSAIVPGAKWVDNISNYELCLI